ncbi:Attachment invasion locus protein precursor [Photobacterium marinum]|uniref:Attachment invasion locus protein n=1 Tax=Photobacterium marinum TaxID=1056511 RepID=L8J7R5_9GAMM|nr:Ail/Lom family outer membrane beta-barrel protein [Photobacterium marinum]ELR64905.1 Attachment invasion locus protein precursor [Photobacterium marinum]
MKKAQHIILAAIAAVTFSTSAIAGDHTLVASFAKTKLDSAPDDLNGFNLKYRYEGGSRLGFIASGTFTGSSHDSSYADMKNGKLVTIATTTYGYGSFSLGPVYRLNPVLSVYSTVGYAGYFISVEDKINNKTYIPRDEDMFSAGLGVQANVTNHLVVDAGYEYAPFGSDENAGTFTLGLGYRF